MSSTTKSLPSTLLARRLYRNLLRASEPFTAPSPNAAVLSCLLHRTGVDDHIEDWESFISEKPSSSSSSLTSSSSSSPFHDSDSRDVDLARDLRYSYSSRIPSQEDASNIASTPRLPPSNRTHQRLFRRLLREVVAGTDNYNKLVFPSQVEGTRLRDVIRREFRAESHDINDVPDARTSRLASSFFDDTTRRQVAFAALRELNKKLSYFDTLNEKAPPPIMPEQAAYNVAPLPFEPPSSYLRPGVFLVSHPFLNDGFFSKAVVCILEHNTLDIRNTSPDDSNGDGSNDDSDRVAKRSVVESQTNIPGQTYGLIINRVSVYQDTGRNRTLRDAFQEHMLPGRLADVFGESAVREGGPVHVALQMVHSVQSSSPSPSSEVENDEVVSAVGGRLIPAILEGDQSPALYSDRATYFQGNMFKAMSAVEDGTMDRDDISFFVGASTWAAGQLASEIAQGYWIPCRGPPEMALHGICEHEPAVPHNADGETGNADVVGNGRRPLADLWLSMLSACGKDEAMLSHLFLNAEDLGWDENGLPCDAFDDDEDSLF